MKLGLKQFVEYIFSKFMVSFPMAYETKFSWRTLNLGVRESILKSMNKCFNFIIYNYIKKLKAVVNSGNYLQDRFVSELIFA